VPRPEDAYIIDIILRKVKQGQALSQGFSEILWHLSGNIKYSLEYLFIADVFAIFSGSFLIGHGHTR
jgi:hypothetical protein